MAQNKPDTIEIPKARKQGSPYAVIQEILGANPHTAFNRDALVKKIYGNITDKQERSKKYWYVAFALRMLEEDGLVEKRARGNVFYYFIDQ